MKKTVTNTWLWQRLKLQQILRCDELYEAPPYALLLWWEWWENAGVGRGSRSHLLCSVKLWEWSTYFWLGDILQERPEIAHYVYNLIHGEGQVWRQPPLPRGSKPSKWRTRGDHRGAMRPLETAEESQRGQSPTDQCGTSPGRLSVPTPSIYLVAWTYF